MLRSLALRSMQVAALAGGAAALSVSQGPAHADALSQKAFRNFELVAKRQLTPDTAEYSFRFPDGYAQHRLGLETASYLVARQPPSEDGGKPVIRPYTPVSDENEVNRVRLVVKSYDEGQVSKHIGSLQLGDKLAMKGPFQVFEYTPNMYKCIGMIAGGSGITPMLQIIRKILENPRDHTEVRLIFANRSPDDVILKSKLDALAWKHPNFKVTYTVDRGNDDWRGAVGHVNESLARSVLPPPTKGTKILVCGPPPMVKAMAGEKTPDYKQGELRGMLAHMGYTPDQVHKY